MCEGASSRPSSHPRTRGAHASCSPERSSARRESRTRASRSSTRTAPGWRSRCSSVPVRRGEHVVGVFGQVSDLVEAAARASGLPLTPRQAEVLDLLERGRTTAQIAAELHLSIDTVRNHVRTSCRPSAHTRGSRRSRSRTARTRSPFPAMLWVQRSSHL